MTLIIAAAYVLAALAALGFIHAPRRVSPRLARILMIVAFCAQTIYLLFEAVRYGNIPISNLSETLFFFLWFTVLVTIFVERAYRVPALIAYLMPLMMAFALPAMLLAGHGASLPKKLAPIPTLLHVVPTFLGYALFAVGSIASLMYLLQEHRLKVRMAGPLFERLPSLHVLDAVAQRSIVFGFPVFTLGLLLGVAWARSSGHLLSTHWYADPKIISGIITWIIYLAIVHVRLASVWHGRKVAWFTITGFIFILFTFVGTFLLGGQHAFKSSDVGLSPPLISYFRHLVS
jgi:ABC-type transport system involved in cytochrome c biogenesis permease subunit